MNPYTQKNKVPILRTPEELKAFLEKHPNEYICLYLAYKNEAAWDKSTSRVYFNQIQENIIYAPINVKKGDEETLEKIYDIAEQEPRILGINQTQPHKSNSVLQRRYGTGRKDVDTLIKNEQGNLQPYNLNGPSFVNWFIEEVKPFTNQHIILLGVGGVGSPIARKLAKEKPRKLILIDIHTKEELLKELQPLCNVEYQQTLPEKPEQEQIFINAAGKEGVENTKQVIAFLEQREGKSVFVDLRPHLDIPIVEQAKKLGWDAHTGYGMNARNDYTLLEKLTQQIQETPISFEEFKELVKQAS